jgi:hypothetical protein
MPTRTTKKKSPSAAPREGKLGGPGYTRKSVAGRRKILRAVVKKHGYRSALSSIMGMERSATISATARRALASDRVFLRETFGAAATKKRTAARRPAASTRRKLMTRDELKRAEAAARARGDYRAEVAYSSRWAHAKVTGAARGNPFGVDDYVIAQVVAAVVEYLGKRGVRQLGEFNALPRDERRPKLIAVLEAKMTYALLGPAGLAAYPAGLQIAKRPRLVEHLLDLIEEYGPAAAEHATDFATSKLVRKNSLRIRTGRTATVTTYLNPEREECPTHSVPLLNGRCIPCEYENDVGMKTNRRRK